ncbi:MAG: sulfotransferase [Caulobacteraceae bacterium]
MSRTQDAAPDATPDPIPDPIDDDPVFVCAPHRSRGTYLQRLLNIHPRLVVWGEHGGLINKLAEIDQIGKLHTRVHGDGDDGYLAMFAAKRVEALFDYDPWANPLQAYQLREHHRRFLSAMFRRGLAAEQRWGVKEIRYNSPATVAFLAELYPRAQFLILRRDLVELCVSNILATWSANHLLAMGAGATLESAREVLSDCAYALCAIDAQLQMSAALLGPRAQEVGDAAIAETMGEVFRFLDLPAPEGYAEAVTLISGLRLGETPKEMSIGCLDRRFIEENAPEYIALARKEIFGQGLDLARLRRLAGRGRYSFLAGDHDLRHTTFSSLF